MVKKSEEDRKREEQWLLESKRRINQEEVRLMQEKIDK
jgi:hypothetical protein